MNTQALKPCGLRIGNLIQEHNLGILKIELIDRHTVSGFANGRYGFAQIEDCAGILLTEEWHNKFGSFKSRFNSFKYQLPRKNNIDVLVNFYGDYVAVVQDESKGIESDVVNIWNKDLTKRDMYVHEWQNLFWCLTGEELEIKI